MNTDNENYLKKQLGFLGFGNNLNTELENKLQQQPGKFEIPFTAEFKRGDTKELVDFKLNYAKSKTSDMVFLNNYTATLKRENTELEHTQIFYVGKNNNITAKEAFNLLDGRAVNKDFVNRKNEDYNTWLQMSDVKEKNGNYKLDSYTAKYGFDLEKNVSKIPMKELESTAQKEDLMKSLRKGNLTPVTLLLAGKEEKAFLEANPKDRSIILYDSLMIRQRNGVNEHQSESKREGTTKSENQKQEQKVEPEPEQKRKQGRKVSAGR